MPKCPFYENNERMFVSCRAPEYSIITQYTNLEDKKIQTEIYCNGETATQRYCEIYRIIEAIHHRESLPEAAKMRTIDQIIGFEKPKTIVRNGRMKISSEQQHRKRRQPGAQNGGKAAK